MKIPMPLHFPYEEIVPFDTHIELLIQWVGDNVPYQEHMLGGVKCKVVLNHWFSHNPNEDYAAYIFDEPTDSVNDLIRLWYQIDKCNRPLYQFIFHFVTEDDAMMFRLRFQNNIE